MLLLKKFLNQSNIIVAYRKNIILLMIERLANLNLLIYYEENMAFFKKRYCLSWLLN